MSNHIDKSKNKDEQTKANADAQKRNPTRNTFQFVDNRPEATYQRQLQSIANNSPQVAQLKLMQNIVDGQPKAQFVAFEPSFSINSSQEAPLQRVSVNDDPKLEDEADKMGAKALQLKEIDVPTLPLPSEPYNSTIVQRFTDEEMEAFRTKRQEERYSELGDISKGVQERQENGFLNERQEEEAAGEFKSIYDGSLQSLAEAMFKKPKSIKALKDSDLVDILKRTFESNWFKAKKCLTTDFWPNITGTRPPHTTSIMLMQAMVDMRGRVWDKFVFKVQSKIKDVVKSQKEKGGEFQNLQNPDTFNDNFGLKESVGSESVTSDIDLSAKGENTEIGVAMINAEFRKIYGTEPGAFFDINVYSSDWMFKPTEVIEDKVVKKTPTSEAKALTGQDLSEENQRKKDDRNEVWSMVKVRRNMIKDDWDTYKEQILNDLNNPSESRTNMIEKFRQVDEEYKAFHDTVEVQVEEIKRAINYEETKQKSAFDDRSGHDHFEEESMEMAASNREYERIILHVKELRLKVKRLQEASSVESRTQIEELLLEIHDEVARGLTYANEVYATEGAVLHTVFGNQGAKKELAKRKAKGEDITDVQYILTKKQYLQSLNENVGDTLHSLKHNSHDPQYAVYRAGKYIARLCDAADNLITKTEAENIPGYNILFEIGQKSVEEKKGLAGKDPLEVRESGSYIHQESFFAQYERGDLSVVKSLTIGLGAKAAAIYKKSE